MMGTADIMMGTVIEESKILRFPLTIPITVYISRISTIQFVDQGTHTTNISMIY